jgi:uracil-DNA glycosylase
MIDIADIDDTWKKVMSNAFKKESFTQLGTFLEEEAKTFQIYPTKENIFAAFNHTPFHKIKAVIIGQDPYHGLGQANGLSFSVNPFIKLPPSLKNIFKELKSDLGYDLPFHGDLTPWAKQGVLLLNATLTVRAGTPGSHQKKGWEQFTDGVIASIAKEKENIVFLLWGNSAIQKSALIDASKHCVLAAPHPSPLARGGFFGNQHFSKTNAFLESKNIPIIDWKLE